MGEKHSTNTASLHVPEPQADLGPRSIRNPPLMHEGMRGNNVGMYGHSGAIRSARGCGQYYHSFFNMHPNYWHYCRTPKMNKARPNINGTRRRFYKDPTRTLEPRSLHSDSRFDPFIGKRPGGWLRPGAERIRTYYSKKRDGAALVLQTGTYYIRHHYH